jgi:hypothetical protein
VVTNPPGGKNPIKKVSLPMVLASNVPATISPATNAPVASAAAVGGSSGRLLMAIGLLVAAGLVISFVMRSRRPHSSLITDSMNVPPAPPRKP